MSHDMKWNEQNHNATCSCGLVLIVSSSRELAAVHHAEHLKAEQLQPTSPTTLRLAQLGRSKWSGYY